MAYIVNGSKIFRDPDRDYEYNGSTDRFVDIGPASKSQPSYSHDVIRTMDEVAQRQREDRALDARIQQRKEDEEYRRIDWELFGKPEQEARRQREKEQREIETFQETMDAYRRASERYHEHSKLFQLFHKRPSLAMSADTLDSMYQGRAR